MAHRRPWQCYSKWDSRPYQYKRSSSRKREYARGGAQSKIIRYWGGNKDIPWQEWDLVLGLKATKKVQVSSNALEAIRVTINSALTNKLGRTNFRLRVKPIPFHKIRENRMLAFAGADRVQSGMRNSFGRPTGTAARVKAGAIIAELGIYLKNLDVASDRLRIAGTKMPCACQAVIIRYKTFEDLKHAGLPLYDDKKRKEIPVHEIVAA
jgi:large subunit ribosomal protein L10e